MNYRHAYHAGNFADVFKHIVLIALVQSLAKKESPFCFLETHAGAGHYDLDSEAAQKSKEYENGIAKIIAEQEAPPLIHDYLSCIKHPFYPGSPSFAKHYLRSNDRMVLCELHPEEYATLNKLFRNDRQVAVHHQEGYQGLKAFLPPKERRGIVFIDPPYEKTDELSFLVNQLTHAVQRFETGIFAVWYPIKTPREIERFHAAVKSRIQKSMLAAEFNIYPQNLPGHLNGCGMLMINPPWHIKEQLHRVLPWLLERLTIREGHYDIKTIVLK
jgi:23S rRNA (adenine2030-N6)-methyltransferase